MSTEQTSFKNPEFPELTQKFKLFPYLNQKIAMILIGLIGFSFYIGSYNGEYALDDGIIIHQNDHVIKGTAGIWGILTKDAYESFYRRMCATDQLAGGRYRPLSVVSFAIEQEFIGSYRSGLYNQTRDLNNNGVLDPGKVNWTTECGRPESQYEYNDFVDLNNNGKAEGNECYPCWDLNKDFKNQTDEDLNVDGVFNEVDCQVYKANIRHFNNIWTYALGCIFLYLVFARYFFRFNQDLAFLAALLFTMHPIHSEAIANVKSRDEIFSLIFVSLTFLFSFKYLESKKLQHLVVACIMFLLALLSKEYAIMLLILVPLSVYTFTDNDVYKKYINTNVVYYIAGIIIAAIVVAFIHKGIVNPLFGGETKGKLLTRGVSFLIFCGLCYVAINFINTSKKFSGMSKFKVDSNIVAVLVILLGFIACVAFMTLIKYKHDIKVPPPAKATNAYWLFPFVYIFVILIGINRTIKENKFLSLMAWFGFIMLFYVGMRWVAVKLKPGVPDTEILNNPYLLANEQERFCTKAFVLMKYLILQVFPHPLSSDYSYNTIHYRHFKDWDFLLAFIIHLGLLFSGIVLSLRRHVLGFCIMVYILFALLIGNVLMDVGATMGERLIFHSNIGFCIAMAWFILKGFEKLQNISLGVRRAVISILVLAIGVGYGCKCWERSLDWKNDVTLFLKDVKTMPHSVLVLGNAGARWVDLADTKEVTGIPLAGQENKPYNDYNGTLKITDEDLKMYKTTNKREAALYKGVAFLKHAVELHPRYVNGYLNLGLAHFKLRKDFEALYYWKNAERLYPNNPYLRSYYQVYSNDLKNRGAQCFNRGRMDSAAYHYNMATILDPYNAEAWYNMGGAYFNRQKFLQAKYCWERAVQINPNYNDAKANLSRITPAMLGQQPNVSVPLKAPKNGV